MNDPVTEAAAQLSETQTPATRMTEANALSVEPALIVPAVIDPNAAASPAERSSESEAPSSVQNASRAADTEANASNAGANEHAHTSLLRGLVSTLRRKWNVFDAELEALLKDAESSL